MRFSSPLFIAGLVGLFACSAADSSSDGSAKSGLDAGRPQPSASCEQTPSLDLEGTWALITKFSLRLRSQAGGMVTMCPEGQKGEAFMSFLVQISRDASDPASPYTVQSSACSLELPVLTAMAASCDPESNGLLSVQIPIPERLTSVLPSIVEAPVDGWLSDTGEFSTAEMPFTFGGRSERETLPLWQLARPKCGLSDFELGHSKVCEAACVDDCEAAYDDDSDGYPGVSVDVCGFTQDDLSSKVLCRADAPNQAGSTIQGRMAIVFRAVVSLLGKVRSSCEVTGAFGASTDYTILGAEAYLTNTNIPVASVLRSLPLFDADPENNRFRMIRVDGRHGAADWGVGEQSPVNACSVIRSRKNDLL